MIHVCVDTFHHPYVQLERTVCFPEVHLERGHALPQSDLLERLQDCGVDWFRLQSYQHLKIARSAPDSLHLGRVLRTGNGRHAFLLVRVRAAFLGGAADAMPRRQGISPEFSSDRVYFHAHILPLGGDPSTSPDLPVLRYAPSSRISVQKEAATGWFRPAALFDSPDFSEQNRSISHRFAFGTPAEFLSLFSPFQIEYGALTLALLAPVPGLVDDVSPRYLDLLDASLEGTAHLSSSAQQYWRDYYGSFKFTRFLSPTGNPHWRFDSFPGASSFSV